VVDVRDVADLHVAAMTHPAASGERFLAVAGGSLSLLEIANVLRGRLGPLARKAPTREVPDWLLRITALFNPMVRRSFRNWASVRAQPTLRPDGCLNGRHARMKRPLSPARKVSCDSAD